MNSDNLPAPPCLGEALRRVIIITVIFSGKAKINSILNFLMSHAYHYLYCGDMIPEIKIPNGRREQSRYSL